MRVVFHDRRPGDFPNWTIERTIRHLGGDQYEVEVLEKTPANPEGRIRCGRPTPFTLRDGVVRWNTNGAIPDLRTIRDDGIDNLEGFVKSAHEAAYNKHLDAVLTAYRQADPEPDPEILNEARADGAKVLVNVITGRRTYL